MVDNSHHSPPYTSPSATSKKEGPKTTTPLADHSPIFLSNNDQNLMYVCIYVIYCDQLTQSSNSNTINKIGFEDKQTHSCQIEPGPTGLINNFI